MTRPLARPLLSEVTAQHVDVVGTAFVDDEDQTLQGIVRRADQSGKATAESGVCIDHAPPSRVTQMRVLVAVAKCLD